MISICTTIKNRSRVQVDGRELRLFPNCVQSIVAAMGGRTDCELVVADWQSDDWPLAQWLPQSARPMPVRILTLNGPFSRGHGLNEAAKFAGGDILFFIDADALVCEALFTRGLECLRLGKAYFPVCYAFASPDQNDGKWLSAGSGQCMLTSVLFLESGGWPEYDRWGKEDDDFFSRVASLVEVVREEVPGFYHQWHPDDIGFKDQYSARAPFLKQELEQIEIAWRELAEIIRPEDIFILVDEARFGKASTRAGKPLPFMEHDGEYWGPPADDAEAIAEVERLRGRGATYIVFAWMAFWWLDYYADFHKHLRSRFQFLFRNERIAVFSLPDEGTLFKKGV